MKNTPSYPQSIRFSDDRNDPPRDYYCDRAVKLPQFENAFQTLHDSYHQRKFIASRQVGLWMTRYHLLPTTRVFSVTNATQAAARPETARPATGTLTLVEDGPLGLPMETLFHQEIALRRNRYGPIAEATCLALDERGATTGPEMVDRLMGVVAQAARWSGITQILISVHPRHAPYYKRMAGFLPIGKPQPYPVVRGHLAVPLALHLPTLSSVCPAGYDRYFEMHFPTSLLNRSPIPQNTIQQLSKLWQGIQSETQSEPQDKISEILHGTSENRRAA